MDDYLLLARVLEDANQIQRGGLFTSRDSKTEKIKALLEGPSITRQNGKVPLDKRTLLGSARDVEELTPQQLLERMQKSFEQARDIFIDIDAAMSKGVHELAELRADFARMEERATSLKAPTDRPSFIELQDLQSDPLNAHAGLESLKRGLKAWARNLDEIESARTSAQAEVERAKHALAQLQGLDTEHRQLSVKLAQWLDLATLPAAPAVSKSQMDMLAGWVETLASNLQQGQWQAVTVGVKRLNLALDEAISTAHRVLAQVRNQTQEMEDLAGLYKALKAKDHRLSHRDRADQTRKDLSTRIDEYFSQRPLDLVRLKSLVSDYQRSLTAHGQ
jgi:chromosome segregation ATPase